MWTCYESSNTLTNFYCDLIIIEKMQKNIYAPSLTTAKKIAVTVSLPRQCDRQVPEQTLVVQLRSSIAAPFTSLTWTSLFSLQKSRFSETNIPAFTLYKLHLTQLEKGNRSEYKALVQTIQQFYSFDNFEQEAMSRCDMQKQGLLSQSENLEKLDLIDLVRDIELYPAVSQAFITLLTLPATTCKVER